MLYRPHLLEAVLAPNGEIISTYRPKAAARVPISLAAHSYMINAFSGVSQVGTASGVYGAWPQNTVSVG